MPTLTLGLILVLSLLVNAILVFLRRQDKKRNSQLSQLTKKLINLSNTHGEVLERCEKNIRQTCKDIYALKVLNAKLLVNTGRKLEDAGFLEEARVVYEGAQLLHADNSDAAECLNRLSEPQQKPLFS